MKYCKNCGVGSLDEVNRCPLCEAVLTEEPNLDDIVQKMHLPTEDRYPETMLSRSWYSVLKRIYMFLVILIVVGSIALDIFVDTEVAWSIISIAAVLYSWTLINHAIKNNVHIGSKIFVQAISASVFIFLIDRMTGFDGWSVNYVIPQILILANVVIFILMMINRMVWREFLFYQLAMTVIGLVPILLILLNVVSRPLTSVVCAVMSAVILLGTVIFGDKNVKSELIRRFHI